MRCMSWRCSERVETIRPQDRTLPPTTDLDKCATRATGTLPRERFSPMALPGIYPGHWLTQHSPHRFPVNASAVAPRARDPVDARLYSPARAGAGVLSAPVT